MHWKKITGDTGVIETKGTMIPLYRTSENRIAMIDSGSEENPELVAAIERAGFIVSAVLCTHLHPDHIANNRLLVEKFGTKVYAPEEEIRAAHTEVIQCGKFRMNQSCLSEVPDYPIFPVERQGTVLVDGKPFEVIDAPGHTKGHVAYVTADEVCCAGDALSSAEVVRFMKLPYFECVKTAMETMNMLEAKQYPYYVLSHCSIEDSSGFSRAAQAFADKREDMIRAFREVLGEGRPQGLAAFMQSVGIIGQDLVESTILQAAAKSYLNGLVDTGEVKIEGEWVLPLCLRERDRESF